MKYLSLCSGIEAASVAWHPLGWRPFAFSEIDAFPAAVLAHHYPATPNLGDMTKFKDWPDATFDILVGGTPCQSFSVAGLRKGLHDPRGNLMLTFGAIAARYRPAWLVWENVPGVLSSNAGRDFGTFLGMLGELGYGFAYRVLDAQFFGVPQRRRRVFVVGYLGNWRPAFAVLFERHSLQGHPAPRREARKGIAGNVAGCLGGSSQSGGFRTTDLDGTGAFVPVACNDDALKTDAACPLVMSSGQANAEIAHDRAPTLNCLHEAPILAAQAIAIQANCIGRKDENGPPQGLGAQVEVAYTLEAREVQAVACEVADSLTVGANQTTGFVGDCVASAVTFGDVAGTLKACSGKSGTPNGAEEVERLVAHPMQVRRLTPRECERLQGFPDDYTLIQVRGKPAADGSRYKALGNSFAVPVVRWLGERIQLVDSILAEQAKAAE